MMNSGRLVPGLPASPDVHLLLVRPQDDHDRLVKVASCSPTPPFFVELPVILPLLPSEIKDENNNVGVHFLSSYVRISAFQHI